MRCLAHSRRALTRPAAILSHDWFHLAAGFACISAASIACAQTFDAAGTWPTFAGNNARNAISRHALPSLSDVAWTLQQYAGLPITWLPQATPVVSATHVFAIGSTQAVGGTREFALFCVSRNTGSVAWRATLPQAPILESQSSAAIDFANGTVLVAAGNTLAAFDLATGVQRWSTVSLQPFVNASPLVTDDLGPRDRVFITTYSPGLVPGELLCINIDPFDAGANPWQPGEIVWSVALGNTSGNTPAMLPRRLGGNSLVVVSTIGDAGLAPGGILAFDAGSPVAPAPAWTFANTRPQGFFGGCTIAIGASGSLEVVAASYAFSGGVTSANTVRLDARTGVLLAETPTNRTNANPIVLPTRRIALATGISGFGSAPSLLWLDSSLGPAAMLWHAARDTWIDADGDGRYDAGEYLRLSGYNTQPAASIFAGRTRLLVPTMQPSGTTINTGESLSIVDPSLTPVQLGFVTQSVALAGGSVALAGANAYSIGSAGLVAFGPVPARFDVNTDSRRNIDDLYAWEAGTGQRDVDNDGVVTSADRDALRALLRSDEPRIMEEQR